MTSSLEQERQALGHKAEEIEYESTQVDVKIELQATKAANQAREARYTVHKFEIMRMAMERQQRKFESQSKKLTERERAVHADQAAVRQMQAQSKVSKRINSPNCD
jgi:hypothetical protein